MSKNINIEYGSNGTFRVTLYSTAIVSHEGGLYQLNSGGYKTATTKRHMNKHLERINAQVVQKDFRWYVHWNGRKFYFEDGMILNTLTGEVYASGYTRILKAV